MIKRTYMLLLAALMTASALGQGFTKDFLLEVERGKVPGHEIIHKFGRNDNPSTTLTPISAGGVYQCPAPSAAVTLEVIAGAATDTAAGTGAREVTLDYLKSDGTRAQATIATNGASASTETVTDVWRLLRAWVSAGGTYATTGTPSQDSAITIRVAGAGATWGIIPLADTAFGAGQSLNGCFTVPAGYSAYVFDKHAYVDSGKSADIFLFQREEADDETAPFSALRTQAEFIGVSGHAVLRGEGYRKFPELTDFGFMAKAGAANTDVAVTFDILLVKEAQ